jgi:hypothetical protein
MQAFKLLDQLGEILMLEIPRLVGVTQYAKFLETMSEPPVLRIPKHNIEDNFPVFMDQKKAPPMTCFSQHMMGLHSRKGGKTPSEEWPELLKAIPPQREKRLKRAWAVCSQLETLHSKSILVQILAVDG